MQRKNSSKFLVNMILLIVVLITLVSVGLFFNASKPSPASTLESTNNWKTYTNIKYNFSFKYPNLYTYNSSGPNLFQQKLNSGEQISGTVAPSFDTIFLDGSLPKFEVGIFHEISALQRNNLEIGFDGSCGTQFGDKTNVNKIDSVDNLKYRLVEQEISKQSNIFFCFSNKNGNLIVLRSWQIPLEKVEFTRSFLRQILSTFKFLE